MGLTGTNRLRSLSYGQKESPDFPIPAGCYGSQADQKARPKTATTQSAAVAIASSRGPTFDRAL
jgi:hypothetical protein